MKSLSRGKRVEWTQNIQNIIERTKEARENLNEELKELEEKSNFWCKSLNQIQDANHDILGLAAITDIYIRTREKLARASLENEKNYFKNLTEKEKNLNNFFMEFEERLNIIDRAEENGLDDFLENNNVLDIFDDKKFENYKTIKSMMMAEKENINKKGDRVNEFGNERE